MCVTSIYIDRYPDGRDVEFRQTSICQYGQPGNPCATLSTLEKPPRKIQYGEPSTQYMLTQPSPQTPPRSSGSSHHRPLSGGDTTSEEGRRRRRSHRTSEFITRNGGLMRLGSNSKIYRPREHRKERIVIVDSPPTPRTPPQVFNQSFTAPTSPATPPYIYEATHRGRPIIVDERPLQLPRAPSVGAVVSERPALRRERSQSRPRTPFESASPSHTSFSLRTRLLEEEHRHEEERRQRRREREATEEQERRRAQRIAEQDEEIRRRPAVPPPPLRQRAYLHPVIDQSEVLQGMIGGLSLDDRGDRAITDMAAERRRKEERDRLIKLGLEAQEEEALKQRLRERQMPRRRFSVGPGYRRHRVLYDDGMYRWE